MAIPKQREALQQQAYVECPENSGLPAQRVKPILGDLLDGAQYDRIDATYPDAVTEIYTYSLAAVQTRVLTVVYTDDTKEFLLSVARTA